MTIEEQREQVAKQCEAVVHLAKALIEVHSDYARMFRIDSPAMNDIADQVGNRTARLMEMLGDVLNGMDAVEKEDAVLDPIFVAAHKMFPQPVLDARDKRIDALEAMLWRCADRLERCAVLSGTAPAYAAIAVQEYRDLLTSTKAPV